mgnify:CR=1 FL=1
MKKAIFFLSILLATVSCKKSETDLNIRLASNMLINKTWYLDYSITDNKMKTYLGQQTYFINFFDEIRTSDSDGVGGIYNLSNMNGQLILIISGQTSIGNSISSSYVVENIGNKNMVLSFVSKGVITKQYYSTR